MMTIVTTETIIDWLTKQIEQKLPIDPNMYMEASIKLNVLLQGEQEKLYELEQEVALLKKVLLEDGKTVAYTKIMIEGTNEWKECKKQKAKIDRIVEFIRLSKLHSRTASDLMRSNI